jgi:thymidine kinase
MGTLDIIAGPMYSGKTSSLLNKLFIEAEIGLNVLYINHSSDNRSDAEFSTHNPLYKEKLSKMSNVKFASMSNLEDLFTQNFVCYNVIGIDEAQFFNDLYKVVKYLVEKWNLHVIVAGLNGDHKREMFGQIHELEPLSDSYTKLTAFCRKCAETKKRVVAPFTYRKQSYDDKDIVIGGKDIYIPVCRSCYLELRK